MKKLFALGSGLLWAFACCCQISAATKSLTTLNSAIAVESTTTLNSSTTVESAKTLNRSVSTENSKIAKSAASNGSAKIAKSAAAAKGAAAAKSAASTKEDLQPILSFKTNIYTEQGASNSLSIVLGTTDSTYLYVDCGMGQFEVEVGPARYDSASTAMKGTLVECTVTQAGQVTVYGTAADALLIDYLNADGCYITEIDLSKLTNLDILSLSHNMLTDIDLSHNNKIEALYISDNTFSEATPLQFGTKPLLQIVEIQNVAYIDPAFDMTQYPKLKSFDAYHCPTLTQIDPTACDSLLQLTLEMTNVKTLDVSKNKYLLILNISETGITELDVTHNPWLQQLYCEHVSGTYNVGAKLNKLDVSKCPLIYRLICNGNNLTTLDLTNLTYLISLSCMDNNITSLDLSNCTQLSQVKIDGNRMDFATLPFAQDTWEEYSYAQQKLPAARSYKEGTVLDFSTRVLRAGTITDAALYSFDVTTPDTWVQLDSTYFSYKDGIVTLKKACNDSLFIAFANDKFPENHLYTEHFMVKTESEYGKPSLAFSFTAEYENVTLLLGMRGASATTPKTFYVCFNGDTAKTAYTTDAEYIGEGTSVDITAPQGYSTCYVYVPEGEEILAIDMSGESLSSIDVTKLIGLQELDLSSTGLYNIDLRYNRWLTGLSLENNNLYDSFSLEGVNSLFAKNVLSQIYLGRNNITDLTLNPPLAIRMLDVTYNQIEKLDLSDADSIVMVDLSHNKLTSLNLTHCTALRGIDASYNLLSEITLPTENHLQVLYINNNQFTYENLPAHGNIEEKHYRYAPQADIVIATKGPCVDLSKQAKSLSGTATTFEWVKEDGTLLTEGTDYTLSNGLTRFINTEAGKVYCRMTNTEYPAFADDNALKTTQIEVAGMPTNEIASFVTSADKDTVELSLAAAKEGTALYFDWEGNENVTQYVLGTTYRVFTSPAITHKDTTVRIYTYSPEDTITVLSITGAKMSSFDGSKLNLTRTLTVQDAGLTNITLPTEKNKLTALNLSQNNFTSIDFASYPNLYSLAINNNQLTSLDLTHNQALGLVSAGQNNISSVKFNNDQLWYLDINYNNLMAIDLSGVPNVEQMNLAHNYLTTIDVENLKNLRQLLLNNNFFDFQTLPARKDQYIQYNYYNQAPIDCVVKDQKIIDLSREAQVGDSLTTYTWYLGVPTWNSEAGAWEGENLIEGTEYTVEKGVTTFLRSFDNVMCIMTNGMFPSLYLYTDLMQVVTAIDNVEDNGVRISVQGNSIVVATEEAKAVSLYTISGMLLSQEKAQAGERTVATVEAGAYLLTVGGKGYKVLVP